MPWIGRRSAHNLFLFDFCFLTVQAVISGLIVVGIIIMLLSTFSAYIEFKQEEAVINSLTSKNVPVQTTTQNAHPNQAQTAQEGTPKTAATEKHPVHYA